MRKLAELNIRQDKFLLGLLETGSVEKACEKANIQMTTGYKYLNDPIFLKEYQKLRNESIQQTVAKLQKSSETAVNVLHEIMTDKNNKPIERIESAKNVLNMAYQSMEDIHGNFK